MLCSEDLFRGVFVRWQSATLILRIDDVLSGVSKKKKGDRGGGGGGGGGGEGGAPEGEAAEEHDH